MVVKLLSRVKSVVHTAISLFKSREDLILENLVLRQQVIILKKINPRPKITRFDRVFWTWIRGRWSNWTDFLVIVKPETVVKWHRRGFKLYWTAISKNGKRKGRPRINLEVSKLIKCMSKENINWGAPRIHAELLKLGFGVSERTVSRYLPKREPDKTKIANWKTFLKNHQNEITAMDFFTVPTVNFKQLYGFFIINHNRRKIIHFAVTYNPSSLWVSQQIRNAFPYDTAPKYLIFDRDTIFGKEIIKTLQSFKICPVRTDYKSPWQNGIAERWVGNVRRELLDHVIIFSEKHLVRLLTSYIDYYNRYRCHCALDKDSPKGRFVQLKPDSNSKVKSLCVVGGLHHRYQWKSAA